MRAPASSTPPSTALTRDFLKLPLYLCVQQDSQRQTLDQRHSLGLRRLFRTRRYLERRRVRLGAQEGGATILGSESGVALDALLARAQERGGRLPSLRPGLLTPHSCPPVGDDCRQLAPDATGQLAHLGGLERQNVVRLLSADCRRRHGHQAGRHFVRRLPHMSDELRLGLSQIPVYLSEGDEALGVGGITPEGARLACVVAVGDDVPPGSPLRGGCGAGKPGER